jgi:hypothetical protein
MVSPFVNYDPATRKTDIMMFNSSQLGAMVVKQAPQVMSWDDNRYGIQETLWSASDPCRNRSWDAYQVPPPCGAIPPPSPTAAAPAGPEAPRPQLTWLSLDRPVAGKARRGPGFGAGSGCW